MKSAARPFQQIDRGSDRQSQVSVKLLTEREAAERCRYFDRGCADPVRAFQRWARRWGVPVKYVGRSRLYDPLILSAFLERESWTRRHRPVQTVSRKLDLIHTRKSEGGL